MKKIAILVLGAFLLNTFAYAQSMSQWYSKAQERIDTLRKGNFAIKIVDKNGVPFSGDFSVKMTKHEFPFGIAFDLYESNNASYGSSYSSSTPVIAKSDSEIYQSERWGTEIVYALPVEKQKKYKVSLKFAEIFFDTQDSRICDVYIEGAKFLSNFDVFKAAGGKNFAFDTSIVVTANNNYIQVKLNAIKDNASIKGISLHPLEGGEALYINCGGNSLTTTSGNKYKNDQDYFDQIYFEQTNISAPTEAQWMKAAMQGYFNYGVSGNSFKWSGIQQNHTTPNYTNFDNAVKFTQSIGWELRAHTLLWGGNDSHSMPDWVRNLPTAKAITDTCKMRVQREMTRYKGIVKEYDVINEPLTGHADWLRNKVGDSIIWNCFKWAREVDPDAMLYINDYNVEYNWGQAVEYRDLILKMKSMGAPVSGVGIQAHFWDCCRPNVDELVKNLNILAETGLPLRLTEYDWGTNLTEQQQVEDFVKVATIAFSHPSVNGMISWGLSDKGAWRPNTGYFNANHSPKPAADTLKYYTRKHWATNFDSKANGENPYSFNAYFGNYDIEVKFGDTIKTFSIPCLKENKGSVFVLNENDSQIKGPEFVKATLTSDKSVEIKFDKDINEATITRSNFKFFTNYSVKVLSISIDPTDKTKLKLALDVNVTPSDYLSIYYFPGTLTSTDGGKAKAFGPATVKNQSTGLLIASVINDGNTIEAKFSQKVTKTDENIKSFVITYKSKGIDISEIKYNGKDSTTLMFNLASPIASDSRPTLKYNQGTLVSTDGFLCQTSSNLQVTNLWPKVVKSEVSTAGTRIEVLFNTKLKNVQINKAEFSFTANGQPIEIKSVVESGTDSTKIAFTLGKRIGTGQKVGLSYTQGTIMANNGNRLQPLNNVNVTNKSTSVGTETIENQLFSIYPNPSSDFVQINSVEETQSVKIYNYLGALILTDNSGKQTTYIDVRSFAKGVYTVEVTNIKGNKATEKIIVK